MQDHKTDLVLVVWKGKADLIDFAISELKALLNIYLPWYRVLPVESFLSNQFSKVEIRSCDVHFLQVIIDRAVLIRTFLLLYSETQNGISGTIADLKVSAKFIENHTFDPSKGEQNEPLQTYCIQITGEYKTITAEEQKQQQDAIKQLNFRGSLDYKSPSKRFVLIHNHRVDKKTGIATYDRSYFGWEAVKTLQAAKKSFNTKYALSGRAYLGPTTTDHDLAFLMVS